MEVQRIQVFKTDPATGLQGWREIYKKTGTSPPPPPPPAPPPTPPTPVALQVTITPSDVTQGRGGPGTVTISGITAAVTDTSDVVGTLKWQWSLVSWQLNPSPTFSAPTAATTNLTQNFTSTDAGEQVTIKATAMDDAGNIGSATATFTLYSYPIYRPGSGTGGGQLP